MNDQFKFYALPSEGVGLMREYNAILDDANDQVTRLQKEYQEKAEAVVNASKEQLRVLWTQMATMVGVDAEATWGTPGWHVESRYVDSGFAAITFMPQPVDPLAAIFGQGDAEDQPVEEGAPKGATLN